jgi:hypothetical protein
LLQSGKQKDEGLDESHRSPAFLHVSARTVRLAIDAGELQAEQALWDGPWLVNGQELKSDNAQRLKLRAQRGGRRVRTAVAVMRSQAPLHSVRAYGVPPTCCRGA